MLNLPLDEGYCYDFLAIQQVKWEKGLQSKERFDFYSNALRAQVGAGGHRIILESPEYAACVKANTVTYEGVDDAWQDRVVASYVCKKNDDRHIAKLNLQKKFFPDKEVTELKSITQAK